MSNPLCSPFIAAHELQPPSSLLEVTMPRLAGIAATQLTKATAAKLGAYPASPSLPDGLDERLCVWGSSEAVHAGRRARHPQNIATL